MKYSIKKITKKDGKSFIAFIVEDGEHKPKMFFDIDLICAILNISYKEYHNISKDKEVQSSELLTLIRVKVGE